MKKFLAIGLAALGLAAVAPQPAKADGGFSFSFGPAYYPDYYPGDYYYGRPYYYYGHRALLSFLAAPSPPSLG